MLLLLILSHQWVLHACISANVKQMNILYKDIQSPQVKGLTP